MAPTPEAEMVTSVRVVFLSGEIPRLPEEHPLTVTRLRTMSRLAPSVWFVPCTPCVSAHDAALPKCAPIVESVIETLSK